MKIDRIIGILSILLQKERVTASELAEEFEVSRRTIIRDIDDIGKAGIPITTFQGQGGGISIMESFRLDKTLLSAADMNAILSGLGSLDSVSETKRYHQLMQKLSAEHTDTFNIGNQFIIDLSSWDKTIVSYKIELIKKAIDSRTKISFDYFSPTGESKREIEPYHLIFQWAGWYVWGFCTLRNDYRMFKLTRLTNLKCTDIPCDEREIPVYTCDRLRHTQGGIKASVKFDKSLKWRIIDEFGTELPKFCENGNIILEFTWTDIPSFYRYILSFGDKAEIISPKEYRFEFQELLKKISEKYET